MEKYLLNQFPIPNEAQATISWDAMPTAALGLVLNDTKLAENSPCLIIVQNQLEAEQLMLAFHFFHGEHNHVYYFPDWETLPYDHFSPHQDIISERITVLNHLSQFTRGIVITTAATLMHKLPPLEFIAKHTLMLNVKDQINLDIFKTRLQRAGYHLVSQVREHGEYAIRGSLIDLFPMGTQTPYRIDLFDNEIDSIRAFSVETQLSAETVDAIHLLPAKEFPLTEEAINHFRQEWRTHFHGNPLHAPIYQDISEGICAAGIEYYLPFFFTKTATLFDYLPKNTNVISVGDVKTFCEEFSAEILTRYEQFKHDTQRPLLPPNKLFLSTDEVLANIKTFAKIDIRPGSVKRTFHHQIVNTFLPAITHKVSAPLEPLREYLSEHENRILFCTETIGRREILLQALKTIEIIPNVFDSWQAFLAHDETRYGITVAALEKGFTLAESGVTLFTETELYPHRIMQRRLRKKAVIDPATIIPDLTELKINDPVVHIDHGIGRYLGLQTLTVGGQAGEFLILEYQQNAKLYIPISALHLITRYSGADAENAPINKLGGQDWSRAKKKAAEKIRDVAAELLDLYAKRAARPGFNYSLPENQYAAFCAEFPFEETPDQLQAITQVFADMMSDRPMDRVICGDVGFGKTEVALRAAFLAAQNSKQVAMLVPTTLLAEQHYKNFQNRLAEWPIQVELLSRFKTAKTQKATIEKLAEGKVDIIIGTHKLLQADMRFKDLGLLIIDEEHRFGVKQKEKLKALRTHVDLLTLTATPIPRTLNMALAGIRDLSIITTPPARRLSVKTFVHEYQDGIVQEALLREIMRGGQVYFLHNDIATINKKAEELQQLVKEARVAVAHGQMHEHDLEHVMSSFYRRQVNVLVCSTIIESGIDVPSANTIIINRADKLGLAQLHQLRGRVGRSHHQAYAYMLTPQKSLISNDAKKRLEAIAMFDQLGIGFSLASQDLEIRGAGELLGDEQSGNMHEVGFSLYMELLSRAVDDLQQGKAVNMDTDHLHHRAEIDLHIPALIPEDYLYDVQMRLSLYKRIANAKSVAELDLIQVEMIDRFGLLPDAIKHLFAIAEMKLLADKIGIKKLDASELGGRIEFIDKPYIKSETIIALIQQPSKQYQLDGPNRIRFKLREHDKKDRVKLVTEVLEVLLK